MQFGEGYSRSEKDVSRKVNRKVTLTILCSLYPVIFTNN
jgi:hypothetical protein